MSDLAIYRTGSVLAALGNAALVLALAYALRLWWRSRRQAREDRRLGRDPNMNWEVET